MKKESFLLIFICLFISCGETTTTNHLSFEERNINIRDIFSQNEERYLSLFYSPTCKACVDTLKILKNKYEENPFPIYLINIHDNEINYCDEFISCIGVSDYQEIQIYSTPIIFLIDHKEIKKEAKGLTKMKEENFYISFL